MNKKLLITFGIIGLFMFGFVGAGLVGYLSNQAEVSVTVESPVLLEVSDGHGWLGAGEDETATLNFDSIYGGEEITFWIRDTNLADVAIKGYSTKEVTNVDGVTCLDFASVTANGNDILTGYCKQGKFNDGTTNDPNTIDFSTYTAGELDAGEIDTNEITLVFKTDALGKYVFTMQKMPGVI